MEIQPGLVSKEVDIVRAGSAADGAGRSIFKGGGKGIDPRCSDARMGGNTLQTLSYLKRKQAGQARGTRCLSPSVPVQW